MYSATSAGYADARSGYTGATSQEVDLCSTSPVPPPTRCVYAVAFWVPSIAVSGIAFYTGSKLPKWKGDVLVAVLRIEPAE